MLEGIPNPHGVTIPGKQLRNLQSYPLVVTPFSESSGTIGLPQHSDDSSGPLNQIVGLDPARESPPAGSALRSDARAWPDPFRRKPFKPAPSLKCPLPVCFDLREQGNRENTPSVLDKVRWAVLDRSLLLARQSQPSTGKPSTGKTVLSP
jgi:hypothetical protein